MMRSLYSAISGLKNHQTKMDVIGNNIANVNTTGFKRSRVTFSTTLSQTLKGASSPSANQGGTNPAQVGLGSILGSIDQIMTPGSAQSTGKNTDMMLEGSGFFVLDNGGNTVYSRSGGFSQDKNGYLEDPATGARVQGFSWGTDDTVIPTFSGANYGAIKFAKGDVLPLDNNLPVATTTAKFTGAATVSGVTFTAESAGPPVVPATLTGLDGAGNLSIPGMTETQAATPGANQYTFDRKTGTVTFPTGFATPTAPSPLNVTFVPEATPVSVTGLTAVVNYPPTPGATVYITTAAGSDVPYTAAANSAAPGDGEYAINVVNGKYQITFGTNEADGSTPTPLAGNKIGYDFVNKPHTLESFSIDQSGVVTGVYSNGVDSTTHKIAQVAVANFANDAGLENVGGSFYVQSNNSGTASVGAAGEEGRATIVASEVEMSNVDLSQEFTDMIVAQRGFQANSRVITVSDTLLQELIDLKRQ